MKALSRAVWVLIVIVILVGVVRLIRSTGQRSPDQQILIEKSK